MANKPLNPRCKVHPGRKYVKGCKCISCLACVAENKLNKRLRDARCAELRETLRQAGHPLYADKPAKTKSEEPAPVYDPASPINIFNHPPFPSMTLRQVHELEDSWP
jgi:hypothetical protein